MDPRSQCHAAPLTLIVESPPAMSGSISGAITVDGDPLDDVSVGLLGDAEASTSPDENGHYAFTDLDAGTYAVVLAGYPSTVAFEPDSQQVTLSQGEAATVDFPGTLASNGAFDGDTVRITITGTGGLRGPGPVPCPHTRRCPNLNLEPEIPIQ